MVLLLFKVYSVVSEWVQSVSLPLFVIPMAFVLFVLFGGKGEGKRNIHILYPGVFLSVYRKDFYFASDLHRCRAFPVYALLPDGDSMRQSR